MTNVTNSTDAATAPAAHSAVVRGAVGPLSPVRLVAFVCLQMTSENSAGGRWALGLRMVRDWWPLLMIVAVSLAAQHLVLDSRYEVGGHAAEHLTGASAPFMASAMVSILGWSTAPARRQLDLIVAAAAWLSAAVLVMMGNLRVVDDLVAAGHARTATGAVPDVADHSLANTSVWVAEAAALVFVIAWRRRRHAGNRMTAAALTVTVLVPPWIIPGAGVIVLAVASVVARVRADRRSGRAWRSGSQRHRDSQRRPCTAGASP